MARIRSIKPDFWTCEKWEGVSRDARLLFVGLWTFCDDQGVIPAKVGTIKAQVFPLEPIGLQDIRDWLAELVRVRSLIEFEVVQDGEVRSFLWIRGFSEHQKVDKPTKRFPSPPSISSSSAPGVFGEDSSNTRRGVVEESPSSRGYIAEHYARSREASPPEGSRRELDSPYGESEVVLQVDVHDSVKNHPSAQDKSDSASTRRTLVEDSPSTPREVTEVSASTPRGLAEYPDWFDAMWKAYPKRSGSNPKAEAWKAVQARIRDGHARPALEAGLARYAAWVAATDKAGTEHIMQGSTFFGPSCRFLEPYDLPRRPAGGANAAADAAMAMLTGNVPPPNFDDGPIFDGQAERLDDQGDDDAFLLEG